MQGAIDPAGVLGLQRELTRALWDGHRQIVVDLRHASIRGAHTALMLGGALRRVTYCGATLAIIAGAPIAGLLELCGVDPSAVRPDVPGAVVAIAAAERMSA